MSQGQYQVSIEIKKDNQKLIFCLYDFGGNKGFHWGVEVESLCDVSINSGAGTDSKITLSHSGKLYGLTESDLKKLEAWTDSKKELTLSAENSLMTSDLVLKHSLHKNQWGLYFSSKSSISLGWEKYDFNGNELKSSSSVVVNNDVVGLKSKELERVKKWIARAKKAIVKIEARGEKY